MFLMLSRLLSETLHYKAVDDTFVAVPVGPWRWNEPNPESR